MGLKYLTLLIGQELNLLSVKLTFLHDESSCLKRFLVYCRYKCQEKKYLKQIYKIIKTNVARHTLILGRRAATVHRRNY